MKSLQVALAGLLGLAGLTAGASIVKANVEHLDSDGITYHCQALDIYKCNVLGSCLLFENCAHWCVDLTAPNGAVCADVPPANVEAPREQVKARGEVDAIDSVDNKNGKTYMCTDTHRGVLTCEYDFCYVENGHWCRNGWSCRDECACCRKDKKREINSARVAERTPEVITLSVVERNVPVQVFDTYGSCPQGWRGHQSCREENSVIVVCDPADSVWRAVGKCEGGNGCCELRRDDPYAAQCKC